MSERHDLVVLGGGSGGLAAARRAAALGAKVALVEERNVGGTCVHRGCVPKKLLVYGAGYGDAIADAAGYGWEIGARSLDWGALVAAKNRETARLEDVYRDNLARAGVRLIAGRGTLVDRGAVEVAGERLSGAHILIATGGAPVRPAIEGAPLGLDSDDALALTTLPRRLIVIGGGYVAAELCGLFASAGTDVVVVMRDDAFLPGFDADARAWVTAGIRARGVAVRTGTAPARVKKTHDGVVVELVDGTALAGDHVLFATGRAPRTEGLGLERVGVATVLRGRARAIDVDASSRTSVPGIFAVGDVTGRTALTPVAVAEGRAAAETMFGAAPTALDPDAIPTAVFSHPEVACVGLTEAAAVALHREVDVYVGSFRPLRHALSGRDGRTSLKLLVAAASDRVVGLHVVGDDAAELVSTFAVALTCGLTKAQLDRTIGIHPTSAEELVTLRTRRAR